MLRLFLLLLIVTGCSTSTRVYEKPDFSLTGEKAEKEIEKFTLSYASPSDGKFKTEGNFTYFKMRDFIETMEEISPKSVDIMEDSFSKEKYGLPIAVLFAATAFIKDSNGGTPFYWYGAGLFIGYVVYINQVRDEYVEQFNKDLRKKFAPSLGYTFQF